MKTKNILSKEVKLANEEDFKMIVNFIISNLKKDNLKLNFEFNSNEEIDSYIDYKKNLTIIRIDIVFDTNESITIFECIDIYNINNSNDYGKGNYSYSLIDGKIEDISLHDFI